MNIIKPSVEILTPIDADTIMKHLERCGRVCYRSEHRITDGSAEKFLSGIIKSGHESVLEHYSITFKVICDRAVSHQIVRHRIASYSQESQRYVNAKDSKFINPTKFNSKQYAKIERYNVKLFGVEKTLTAQALGTELKSVYNQLINQGMLKQDARGYLPFNVSTKVMMTFTYADLLHFIKMRDADDAQPEIRRLAKEIQEQLDSNSNLRTLISLTPFKRLIEMIETPRYKKEEEDYLSWENEVDEEVGEVKEEIIENTASAVPESK